MSQITREDELVLFARHRAGDAAATDVLLGDLRKLVLWICSKYERNAVPRDLLEGPAWAGVTRALQLFDPERGWRLGTYVRHWVFAEVSDAARRERDWKAFSLPIESKVLRGVEGGKTLEETLCVETADVEEWIERRAARQMWERVKAGLTWKEREVIERGFLNGESKADIARSFGVSRQRVDQVEKRALRKLRKLAAHYEPEGEGL